MDSLIYKEIVEPPSEQLSEIISGLNSFGLQQTEEEAPARVAIVCKSHNRDVIGGAIGHSLRQRFFLTQLWVSEKHRSKGIGTELVSRMEAIAKERSCFDVVVDTLNTKAVSFYEQLGYQVYLVNPNYIRGFDWHFLAKAINKSGTLPQPTSGLDTAFLG